ncbi:hypothetical protein PINS_up006365 [Pythium insidiosum]|nr:hypothetical protein PINS_up006365 [Pythium insidiosum]
MYLLLPRRPQDELLRSHKQGSSSDGDDVEPRLSAISCNARLAITLNPIDRVEIQSTFRRAEDDTTMYVVDIYLRTAQTGIPTRRLSSSPSDHDDAAVLDDPLERREHDKKPHYRVARRFSDFVRLRWALQRAVASFSDRLHVKWCQYCTRVHWIVSYSAFPPRYPFSSHFQRNSRVYRYTVNHRRTELTSFLQRLVLAAKDTPYRRNGSQCDGFTRISAVLADFLVETHECVEHPCVHIV